MKKTVKAWAQVSFQGTSKGTIRVHDSFHVYAIHPTKERATKNTPKGFRGGNKWKVVPCTIAYEIPTPKEKNND